MKPIGIVAFLVVLVGGCATGRGPASPPTDIAAEQARADSVARAAERRAREVAEQERTAREGERVERAAQVEREREERERAAALERDRASGDASLLEGAVLPAQRIVAFYGNPQSSDMGILGELPPEELLAQLDAEVRAWEAADPETPVIPALHMIAVMAAASPGPDGRYRVRMPARVIQRVIDLAAQRDALVFLDIQPGRSTVEAELPPLLPYLQRPEVHLALDPEWAMGRGAMPGQKIGSLSARAINHVIDELARLVEAHDLPPKILVVHRFTRDMVRNASAIKQDPRVQVVLNMDGWGPPSIKISSYRNFVSPVATLFTGFKVFYKNDRRGGSRLMTPDEIMELSPAPVYIQYQ